MSVNNVIVHPRCTNYRPVQKLKNPKKKTKNKKKVFILVGLLIVVFLIIIFGQMIWLNHKMDLEIQSKKQQLKELEIQQALLYEEIEKIQDPVYIERMARERLGLVKEGEKVIMPATPGDVRPLIPPREGEIQH